MICMGFHLESSTNLAFFGALFKDFLHVCVWLCCCYGFLQGHILRAIKKIKIKNKKNLLVI